VETSTDRARPGGIFAVAAVTWNRHGVNGRALLGSVPASAHIALGAWSVLTIASRLWRPMFERAIVVVLGSAVQAGMQPKHPQARRGEPHGRVAVGGGL